MPNPKDLVALKNLVHKECQDVMAKVAILDYRTSLGSPIPKEENDKLQAHFRALLEIQWLLKLLQAMLGPEPLSLFKDLQEEINQVERSVSNVRIQS